MNSVSQKRATVGIDRASLDKMYQELLKAVQDNINIYKKINVDKLIKSSNVDIQKMAKESTDTISKLKTKLQSLANERKLLEQNVQSITTNADNLSTIVKSTDIKNLSNQLVAIPKK